VPDTALLVKKLRELAILSPEDRRAIVQILEDALEHRRKTFPISKPAKRSGVFKHRAGPRC
jgi:hypothetical protein